MDPMTLVVWCVMTCPRETSLADCRRFPPPDFCRQQMKRLMDRRCWIEGQMAWYAGRDVSDWITLRNEVIYLWSVWDACNAAVGGEGPSEEHRMKWLIRFRELVGEEAYWSGQLPLAR